MGRSRSSRWLRSTFPLCRGVYGLISLCRIPSRAASASNSVGNSLRLLANRFVNSKPLSVCTHSTVIPLRLNAATTFRRKSAEEYVLCSSYAPSTRYLRVFVDRRVLVQLQSRRCNAAARHHLHIDLYALPWPLHLFIRLWLVLLCLLLLRRYQSLPAHHSPQALHAARISPRPHPCPQFHDPQLRVAPAHVLDEFQLLLGVLPGMAVRPS